MRNYKSRVGEKHTTNEGYEIEIIEWFGVRNCTISFTYNNYTLYNIQYVTVTKGNIRNPYHPSVLGIGYLGIGGFSTVSNKSYLLSYKKWRGVLNRCYTTFYTELHTSYKDVTICEEWHNYQNFAEWFEENYNTKTMKGWELDKDILVKGNKIYSPETCCFVPQEINKLFTKTVETRGLLPIGVVKTKYKFSVRISKFSHLTTIGNFDTVTEAFKAYKTAKEYYIKEVADKWKDLISDQVYQAMYNYKVEITD